MLYAALCNELTATGVFASLRKVRRRIMEVDLKNRIDQKKGISEYKAATETNAVKKRRHFMCKKVSGNDKYGVTKLRYRYFLLTEENI